MRWAVLAVLIAVIAAACARPVDTTQGGDTVLYSNLSDHDHTSAPRDGGVLTNDEHDSYSIFINSALAPTPATTTLTFQAFQFGGRVRFVQKGGTGETLTMSRDNAILVRASENLVAGNVVYVDSAAGLISNVTKYIADGSITQAPIGVMMEDTTSGSVGLVMVSGVTGISAGHLVTGAEMWASATNAGDLTTIEPSHPNLKARLGTVISGLAAPFGLVEIEALIVRGDHEGTRLNAWKVGNTLAGAKTVQFYNGSVGTLLASPTADTTWTLPNATGTLRVAAYDVVQDEGTPLAQRDVLNFVGAGVACVDATTLTECTIAGGGAGGSHLLLSTTHADTTPGSPVLGGILYGSATPTWDQLAGNVTAAKQFLTQTGTGAASAVPAWAAIIDGDIPATLVRTSRLVSTSAPLGGGGSLASDLTLTCTTCEITSNKNIANGYAGLNASALVDIARGGTNASSSQVAINNLGQLTTEGDLLYRNGASNNVRLGRGANGQCLTSSTTTVLWGGCGGGAAYATVQEEGAPLTQRAILNFIGTSITCADNVPSTRTDCTVAGGAGAPGGANTQVQFNFSGAFGGESDFTWATTTNELTIDSQGRLRFGAVTTEPAAPASTYLLVYGRSVASRILPKFKGPSGVDSPLQPGLFQNTVVMVSPQTAAVLGLIGASLTSTGTITHPTPAEGAGLAWSQTTSTTGGNTVGTGTALTQFWRGSTTGANGWFFAARLIWSDATYASVRNFVGFTSGTMVLSAGSDNPAGDFAGFQYSTTRPDAAWQFTTKDNVTQALVNTTMPFAGAGAIFDFYIFCQPYVGAACSSIGWRIDNVTAGTSASGTASSNLPRGTIAMRAGYQMSNVSATARTLRGKKLYVETDF